jgi:hypothetical protein
MGLKTHFSAYEKDMSYKSQSADVRDVGRCSYAGNLRLFALSEEQTKVARLTRESVF